MHLLIRVYAREKGEVGARSCPDLVDLASKEDINDALSEKQISKDSSTRVEQTSGMSMVSGLLFGRALAVGGFSRCRIQRTEYSRVKATQT